jgi:SAM-dependent methyltransferase
LNWLIKIKQNPDILVVINMNLNEKDPIILAKIDEETRHSDKLNQHREISRILDLGVAPVSIDNKLDAAYYQELHDTNVYYGINNWLLEHLDCIIAARSKSVLEIGCGNGAAARAMSKHVERVFALDWARSPKLGLLPENCDFIQADVRSVELPSVDLVASADVLEHFTPIDVGEVLKKLHSTAAKNFHVISCYDDKHSHLTIAAPRYWLAAFRTLSPDYRLVKLAFRRGRPEEMVCCITNIE